MTRVMLALCLGLAQTMILLGILAPVLVRAEPTHRDGVTSAAYVTPFR